MKILRILKYVLCTAFVLAVAGGLIWLVVEMGPFLYNYFFQSETINGFKLVPEGDVAVVAEYSGSARVVEMPGELNGLPVTKIYSAGENGKLIREMTIPDSMRIGEDGMIWNFCSVDMLYVSDTHPEYISKDGVLYSRDGKTLVCCPPGRLGTLEIPEGVERIASLAFITPYLEEVVIPDSVRVIEAGAFGVLLNMQPLVIPATVETVEAEAFVHADGAPEIRLIVTEGSAAAQAAAEYGWAVEALLPAAQN